MRMPSFFFYGGPCIVGSGLLLVWHSSPCCRVFQHVASSISSTSPSFHVTHVHPNNHVSSTLSQSMKSTRWLMLKFKSCSQHSLHKNVQEFLSLLTRHQELNVIFCTPWMQHHQLPYKKRTWKQQTNMKARSNNMTNKKTLNIHEHLTWELIEDLAIQLPT